MPNKQKKPKVSLILAVYNGYQYLHLAIESILKQTFTNFEFIIINDGSTDSTAQIISNYHDPRIVVLHNSFNLGLAKSLNRGILISRGEYIARQDADDFSSPKRLKTQVELLDSRLKVGFIGTTSIWIDEHGMQKEIWRQPTDNPQIQDRLLWYCCLVHGSIMMRRKSLVEVGGLYNECMRTGQDYDLWLKMSEKWDVAVIPEPFYFYRRHEKMASRVRLQEQNQNAKMALDNALIRRKILGLSLIFPFPNPPPAWSKRYSRREWSDRFIWWAAGARAVKNGYPLFFMIISFLIDPGNPRWWSFIGGVFRRKLNKPFEKFKNPRFHKT